MPAGVGLNSRVPLPSSFSSNTAGRGRSISPAVTTPASCLQLLTQGRVVVVAQARVEVEVGAPEGEEVDPAVAGAAEVAEAEAVAAEVRRWLFGRWWRPRWPQRCTDLPRGHADGYVHRP